MGDQDGSEADVMGLMAEYAFSKHFNTFPDLGLTPRSGSEDGTYKGYRYDIKSTKYKNGKLLSTLKVNDDVDMYVLATVEDSTVTFPGWAFKKDLIKKENIKNLGHGAAKCLGCDDELIPIIISKIIKNYEYRYNRRSPARRSVNPNGFGRMRPRSR